MSDLRIKILEADLHLLKLQKEEIEEMTKDKAQTLKEAYMERDASLTEDDALEMVQDI